MSKTKNQSNTNACGVGGEAIGILVHADPDARSEVEKRVEKSKLVIDGGEKLTLIVGGVKPQTSLALFCPFVSHLKMGLKRDAFRLDSFLHLNKHLKTFKKRRVCNPFVLLDISRSMQKCSDRGLEEGERSS